MIGYIIIKFQMFVNVFIKLSKYYFDLNVKDLKLILIRQRLLSENLFVVSFYIYIKKLPDLLMEGLLLSPEQVVKLHRRRAKVPIHSKLD